MSNDRRRGGIFLPLLLIALGILFLLENLGWLRGDVWSNLIRLWPLLLIVFGLDMIISRGSFSRIFLGLLIVVVILCAGFILADLFTPGEWTTVEQRIDQPLDSITRAEINIDCNACALRLDALPVGTSSLVEGLVQIRRTDSLITSFSADGNIGHFSIKDESFVPRPFFVHIPQRKWLLQLNPTVPIALQVKSGAGSLLLELQILRLTNLEVKTGGGDAVITLPARGQLNVRIASGRGRVIMQVPHGVGVRMQVNAGSGRVVVPPGYLHEGDFYLSSDYEASKDRVEIYVEAGNGIIMLEEVQRKLNI